MLNNPKEDNKGRDINSSNLIALDNLQEDNNEEQDTNFNNLITPNIL